MSHKLRTRFWQVLGNAFLLFAVFLTVMPYIYMVTSSFKPGSELFSIPVRIFPESLYLGNYELLLRETDFVRWFLNSVFVSAARTALSIVISIMAGYAFAKFAFRFKGVLFVLVIAMLTLPIYVLIVPLYTMMITFGWTDTYIALILPVAAQAIGVFLARQYLLSIPDEMLDAARIDGAGEWTVFWRIILPLSKPVIAVLGILFFTTTWNDFVWPLVVLTESRMFTVSLGLPTLLGPYSQEYGAILAGSFLSTLPIAAVFLVMQRRFVEAITAGAIKG
ncbi:carbohydrate ABC transporter permease [Rubrobacter taiwanensis]|uniref:Carbohydrate ABC transporter permease n=1 Tax=Rubrobacter taiwanensis TaxID=185139 RepID=A0A4R1BEL6_9ACTN|nr:carbohydrate ABC transporter permease [Rubrobacter taiwanensis]TCJ15605.1 carbohydrate ABC transporter permease [Rubrobacter taiwanensis]